MRILYFFAFALMLHVSQLLTDEQLQKPNQEVWATIFIHGIISVKPHLSVGNFICFVRDQIANTTYAHTIEIIRKDPFFYQYHAMQGLGLRPIDLTVHEPGAACSLFARTYDLFYAKAAQNPCNNYYYTFGWSGLLSARMRSLEAELLYKELFDLVHDFKRKNISLKLRIVSYSHGGNVALKLAEIANLPEYYEKPLQIDELILLGVPVLPDANELLEHPLFKNIYHIYSIKDRIQKLDCFAVNRFFSDRIFRKPSHHRAIPSKLTQVQLSVWRPLAQAHLFTQCSHDKTTQCLRHRIRLRNADPGHSELWSFGWVPSHYRKNFPLYPLPAAVLIPYMVESIKNYALIGHDLNFEFHPWKECAFLVSECSQNEILLPFLSMLELNSLCTQALAYQPINFSPAIFDQHVQDALTQASEERKIIQQKNNSTRCCRRIRKPWRACKLHTC